jgi:hypothetical protein
MPANVAFVTEMKRRKENSFPENELIPWSAKEKASGHEGGHRCG